MPEKLSIDIETYSSYKLPDVGVYKYVEARDFAILLFAYAFDDEPVQVVDLASGERLPDRVYEALLTPDIVKCAHNAAFERTCINQYFDLQGDCAGDPSHWECTMAHTSMLGLPLGLGQSAAVLKLDDQKDKEGKALIKYFCEPCKPTKANGQRTCNLPAHDPEKWAKFVEYCRQDVVVERELRKKVEFYVIPETEREMWILDQRINDRGVKLDRKLVKNALAIHAAHREILTAEAIRLTGLANPNSREQVKSWLEGETGTALDTLRKGDVSEMLTTAEGDVKRMLEIRQELSKSSISKYETMLDCMCRDDRARGLLQYYGANRTGRWAGRLIQVQNLTKNYVEGGDLDFARSLLADGTRDDLLFFYGGVSDMLSQLIRGAFIAQDGHRFIVCDASAIEARIVAWLAGEKWRLEVFATHGKIYEASASQMFKVPLSEIGKGSPLRQKGKIAELALGYGGGVNALLAMGALNMGLSEDELQPLVDAWRAANPAIKRLWWACESAAVAAVETGEPQYVKPGITFFTKKNVLFIELPSGRRLSYMRPKLKPGKFDKMQLSYESVNQGQWLRESTYGGKLVENITQAVARDCLAHAMLALDKAGYPIVLHVHDEAVMEVPDGVGSVEEVEGIMSAPIPWAPGLPLGAEGFESKYYKK